MTRPLPPALVFSNPDCPICNYETSCDGDSYYCQQCDVSWNLDGEDPEWGEPDEPQCGSTTYNTWTKITHRCILTAGHEADHGDGDVCSWTTARATPTPAVTP